MATTTTRIFNFAAGPAVLPLPVLEEAQRDLIALPGVGMSVLEISHRSKTFEAIIGECEANVRKLAGIPENYHVLFLQGGATMQFSMVPLNLLTAGSWADYVVTGSWSEKAVKEAKKVGAVNVAFTDKAENYVRVPKQEEIKLTPGAAYVHLSTNETIHGVEYHALPDLGSAVVVADTSSHMFSRPIDVAKYGLIYAGAQKNLGPAGVTLVIVRDDLVKKAARRSPMPARWSCCRGTHVPDKSLYNTPPAFAIYIMGLAMKWLLGLGGLEGIGKINERKAGKLYAEIDRTGFFKGHAAKDSRSRMNVTFRLPNEELEAKFVKEAKAAGMDGLKGHRSVGGLRASIYNAFPEAGVDALVAFMKEFEKKNG
jgi:phosphoserine aminotransferase